MNLPSAIIEQIPLSCAHECQTYFNYVDFSFTAIEEGRVHDAALYLRQAESAIEQIYAALSQSHGAAS